MDIVCDSCSAQLRLPDERVGDRGAKLKCPSCTSVLAFEEGCVKCYSCGFSQC